MSAMNSRLQLAILNCKKERNLVGKGFTLVELMIVIVIVGILSAVALPNFLNQTDKAKATEAKTNSSSIIKSVQVGYLEGSVTDNASACSTDWTPADDKTKFNYDCVLTDATSSAPAYLLVTATGNTAAKGGDASIAGKKLNSCLNLGTGKIKVDNSLDETSAVTNASCN
jgi:type IV pilus assembly protein PilA